MKQMFIIRVVSDKTNFADWIDEHDKQVRADAIEECIKLFKEMQPRLATNVIEFGDMLEQLKEKSNE